MPNTRDNHHHHYFKHILSVALLVGNKYQLVTSNIRESHHQHHYFGHEIGLAILTGNNYQVVMPNVRHKKTPTSLFQIYTSICTTPGHLVSIGHATYKTIPPQTLLFKTNNWS